jgi:hypothetical protein
MVIPYILAIRNIPRKENGMPKATQKESLILKKKPNVINTSSIPIPPFLSNKFSRAFSKLRKSKVT